MVKAQGFMVDDGTTLVFHASTSPAHERLQASEMLVHLTPNTKTVRFTF
jgi:hypothetical protein